MRVLVVEDEQRIAKAIKKGLELERCVVDVAYNGTDGYELAKESTYDVLVLDIMLPGMNGLQICSTLRKHAVQTPILFLTAKGQQYEKIEGLDSGADDYLTKPFDFAELVARVRALARRSPLTHNATIEIGDVILDTTKHTVTRGGKNIVVSPKEFMLLAYLMTHPHQTLTKDQIIEHVWDFESDILPNTVEATIRNIRKKLEVPFPNKPPIIQTVRGFGYTIHQ